MKARGGERSRRDEKAALKKGPWTAEEDAVLADYVRRNGAKDWSSIRTNGLLPRSGKSCRLRWVNKLRPGLKSGCKLSAEEEQIVIGLQADIGNKWATIATYLPGRTDNDVKNFWSTRQKRLARMLHSSGPKKTQRQQNHGKTTVVAVEPLVQDSEDCAVGGEATPYGQCSKASDDHEFDSEEIMDMCADNACYSSLEIDHQSIPPLEPAACEDQKSCCLDSQLPQFYFPQLPKELLDLPLLPEGHELFLGAFDDMAFDDPFLGHGGKRYSNTQHCEQALYGLDESGDKGSLRANHGVNEPWEGLFSDFPVEIMDYDPLPPPGTSGF